MRVVLPALALLVVALAAADPKATSIHPFSGQRGTTFTAIVRGSGLAGATSATVDKGVFSINVEKIETEPPPPSSNSKNKTPTDLVTLRVQIAADAKPGQYPIRLITRGGISNALTVYIVDGPVSSNRPVLMKLGIRR